LELKPVAANRQRHNLTRAGHRRLHARSATTSSASPKPPVEKKVAPSPFAAGLLTSEGPAAGAWDTSFLQQNQVTT
jgi:hypothetical protein